MLRPWEKEKIATLRGGDEGGEGGERKSGIKTVY